MTEPLGDDTARLVHRRLQELARPAPPTGIELDRDGAPRVRGLAAADLAFELGPERLSDAEVLARHTELTQADLDAVKAHTTSRIQFDVLLERVLNEPTHDDVLDAYLFLPRIVRVPEGGVPGGVPTRIRSSFEAAYTDAHNVCPSFIKAIGELVFLDEVSTALTRADTPPSGPATLERALELFSDLTADERPVIYALRNALAHDFSLVNQRPGNSPREIALRHAFRLELDGDGPLITPPQVPWDGGDVHDGNATHVNLRRLTELVDHVRTRIFECYDSGVLKLALSPEETRRRYIFVHGASNEDFTAQWQQDDRHRWSGAPRGSSSASPYDAVPPPPGEES